jgi:hypothetical protein
MSASSMRTEQLRQRAYVALPCSSITLFSGTPEVFAQTQR